MPRSSRYLCDGYTYHLTHRCHNRQFFLKFARDRDAYQKWLRIAVNRYEVPVYGYCITSNHVHIIAHVDNIKKVGEMMHLVAGSYAQQFNTRKGHEGSVWQHPYQCTVIENGQHLLNCLRYVSMNMVRTGVVKNPAQWRWSGHDELTGQRSRYRILNIERLLESLNIDNPQELYKIYEDGIAKQLEQHDLKRKPEWTESLAVGDRVFVEKVAQLFDRRSKFSYSNLDNNAQNKSWAVQEGKNSYSPVSEGKKSR